MIRTAPAASRSVARAALLAAALLLLAVAPARGMDLVEAIRYAGSQTGALARNAAAKLFEKAAEYGYDDIDVLARYGTGLKYPDGLEVRRLDATLALVDLALVATEKGERYASFLFRNPLGRLVFQAIPYATGRHSIPDVVATQMKRALREAFDRDALMRLLPGGREREGVAAPVSPLAGLEIPLPKISADFTAARGTLRALQRGARHLSDPLSAELSEDIAAFFPEAANLLADRLMDDIASGRILFSLLHVIRAYDREFARVNETIARAARLMRIAETAAANERGARILIGVPLSREELDDLCGRAERLPGLAAEIARFGREYWLLARELSERDFALVKPLGERILRIRQRDGLEGLRFVAAFPEDGERFLLAMHRPSSYIKRRVAMASFAARHGLPAVQWMLRLRFLPAWEPVLYLAGLVLALLFAVWLHASGAFLITELWAMPPRRKLALAMLLLLSGAAFHFTLIENARLFLDDEPRAARVYARLPAIPRDAPAWFATHHPALNSAEAELTTLLLSGASFRTAEVDLFRRDIADLRAKYVATLDSFEVRLAGEPRLYENYSSDRILTERDFLIEISVEARNLDAAPRLFPLSIELSTVLGEVVAPVEGGNRLAKTTFNPGVADAFTLTFPFRPEDRPDRIVVRREHLVGASESFLDFGPGTPLRVGDLFAARFGLLFPDRFELRSTGEAILAATILCAGDDTSEVDLIARTGMDSGIFLVARDGRTFTLGTVESTLAELPLVPRNTLVPVVFVFPVDPALAAADLPWFVVSKKKALTEPYGRMDEVRRMATAYLNRLAAAAEFEMGMYYFDPPLYRKWARDVDEARRRFERALELLPDSEPIRQAVRLTRP